MNINKLILFYDVVNTKSFTKSGKRNGYTQAGVSTILKSLENEFGFSLFIRTNQGVVLTKEGEAILPYVESLIEANQKLKNEIDEIISKRENHVTIATFSSISRNWLPALIYKFQNIYSDFEIELMEGGTDEIVKWVENGTADFGLLSKLGINDLKWEPICEDPLMAILPKGYAKDISSFPIDYFINKPFIISDEGVDYDVHEALKKANIHPDIKYTSKDDHAIVSMVANNLGLSILPNLVLNGITKNVDIMPLYPALSRTLGLVCKESEELRPAAKAFEEFLLLELPNYIK